MTRGTILYLGSVSREGELLIARLEREGFMVETKTKPNSVASWLRSHAPQAVLIGWHNSLDATKLVSRLLAQSPKTRFAPQILVTTGDVPTDWAEIANIGEVFHLHELSLAEVIRRLQLAIRLTQVRKTAVSG